MSINVSEYFVSVDLNEDEVIAYSTLSTSIITMSKNQFHQIFELKIFQNKMKNFQSLKIWDLSYAVSQNDKQKNYKE